MTESHKITKLYVMNLDEKKMDENKRITEVGHSIEIVLDERYITTKGLNIVVVSIKGNLGLYIK